MSLDRGQLHLLRLAQIEGDRTSDGWAPVSKPVWRILQEHMPDELLELRPDPGGNGGHCRITDKGRTVLEYL